MQTRLPRRPGLRLRLRGFAFLFLFSILLSSLSWGLTAGPFLQDERPFGNGLAPYGMKLSALVAPWVKVVLANGSIVQAATVQVFTLNPSSDLYKSAESNPSRVLQQDIDFKTQVLVIGPVVNNQVVGKFSTNSSGIAALDGVNPGIYLVWAYQIYLGYFNLVSYLQPGWNFQMQLKPESSAEPNGPYQNPITSSQPAWTVYAEIAIAVVVFVSLGAWAISLDRKRKLKELPAFSEAITSH